jgi:hypothetical protein
LKSPSWHLELTGNYSIRRGFMLNSELECNICPRLYG